MNILSARNSLVLAGIVSSLLLSWLIGAYIGSNNGFDYIQVLIIFVLISASVAILDTNTNVYLGYLMWIVMFVLGYRTIELAPNARLHPLHIMLWFLFILEFIKNKIFKRANFEMRIKPIVYIFGLIWLWGAFLSISRGTAPIEVFFIVINFLSIFPIFILTDHILQANEDRWDSVIRVFFFCAVFIGILGILEYVFPDVKDILPGFIIRTQKSVDAGGFERAGFAFFGHPVATFICLLALPFGWSLWSSFPSPGSRLLTTLGTGTLLGAIYIGGFRSVWMMVGGVLFFTFLQKRNVFTLFFAIAIIVVIQTSLPEESYTRFETGISAIQGDFQDASSAQRNERINNTIDRVIAQPWGYGWGRVGWVHSDFLNVAADTGIIGSVLFVLWYVQSFEGFFKLQRKKSTATNQAILTSFVCVGGLLLVQAVYVLPQLIFPVWFVWALVDSRTAQAHTVAESGESDGHRNSIRFAG